MWKSNTLKNDEADNSKSYRVGDLFVNTGTREVSRDARKLELTALSFDLLVALCEAAPNLLTHDQIVERVWAGRIVSPETITQRVKLLREVLDDDAQDPVYIALVRSAGYRLVADVSSVQLDAKYLAGFSKRQKRLAVALFASIVAISGWLLSSTEYAPDESHDFGAAPNTVAVLPFENLSGDEEDLYLSQGIGDVIRDRLSRVEGLRVVARSSSMATQNIKRPAIDTANRLGVLYLIEGRFRRTATILDVSISLVDGESGLQIWNKAYQQSTRSLLQMQQEMARDLLQVLLPDRAESADLESNIGNLSAQDLMHLARHYELEVKEEQTVDREKLLRAIDFYRQAIDADPDSALAHSRLGGALIYNGDLEAAHAPILRALSLDADRSEVQYTAGIYYLARGISGSGDAFRRAIDLNSNNADALSALAWWTWNQGNNAAPEALYRQALSLDRLSISRHGALTNFYGWSGQPEKALSMLDNVIETFSAAAASSVAARVYESAGAVDEAIAWAMKTQNEQPSSLDTVWYIAELFAIIGETETALSFERDPGIGLLYYLRRYEDAIDLGEQQMLFFPHDVQLKYLLAFAYSVRGNFDKSAQLLEFSGLPGTFYSDTRTAPAAEAAVTLMVSYSRRGDTDQAVELARRVREFMSAHIATGNVDWWPAVHGACAEIVLGNENLALTYLSRARDSSRIPQLPILLDSPCFESVREKSEYTELIDSIFERQRRLVTRLPNTLKHHGFPVPETLSKRLE